MILKLALPLLALLAERLRVDSPSRSRSRRWPKQRHCPAYPLPPAALLKPPAKTDFLDPTR